MLSLVREYWNRWQTYHEIRADLSKRRDSELEILQVGRGDIDRVAWEIAFGRPARTARAPLGG